MKLNLGSGTDYREDYINVDDSSSNLCRPDIIWNLTEFPWPFDDNSADEIYMNQVLEHLPDTTRTLQEIRRILKVGGLFHGSVPYGRSYCAIVHWQHYRYFVAQSFYMMGEHFNFKVEAKNIRWDVGWKWKFRNTILPARLQEVLGINDAYEVVNFRMIKL